MEYFFSILRQVGFIGLGVLGLGLLVTFHELGHFIFCKLFGIKTPSFSIGMGPKILKKKFGETEFSLSAIPMGGYVEIAGLEEVGQGDQQEAKRRDSLSFAKKPYYQKLLVLMGGIIFNLIFAYIAFTFIYKTGMPKIALLFPEEQQVVIKNVNEGSAAQQAGLQAGDQIKSVMFYKNETFSNQPVTNVVEFSNIIGTLSDKKITIFAERDHKPVEFNLAVSEEGKIGVEFTQSTEMKTLEPMGWLASIKAGISSTNTLIIKTVKSFKHIFSRSGVKSVGGPLLIIREIVKSAQKGGKLLFIFLSLISINLAILNLIPLPVFDGGQILFTTLEAIFKRELNEKVKYAIHIVCWVLIIGLMIILTLWDAKRIFMM